MKMHDIRLTPREREVWKLLAECGDSNQEIANQLCISKRTLEKHLKSLSLKLGLPEANRAKLVVEWYRKREGGFLE